MRVDYIFQIKRLALFLGILGVAAFSIFSMRVEYTTLIISILLVIVTGNILTLLSNEVVRGFIFIAMIYVTIVVAIYVGADLNEVIVGCFIGLCIPLCHYILFTDPYVSRAISTSCLINNDYPDILTTIQSLEKETSIKVDKIFVFNVDKHLKIYPGNFALGGFFTKKSLYFDSDLTPMLKKHERKAVFSGNFASFKYSNILFFVMTNIVVYCAGILAFATFTFPISLAVIFPVIYAKFLVARYSQLLIDYYACQYVPSKYLISYFHKLEESRKLFYSASNKDKGVLWRLSQPIRLAKRKLYSLSYPKLSTRIKYLVNY